MTLLPDGRRRVPAALAALLLLDWMVPFGFLHRLFQARRWFPTNITRIFAEKLISPGDPAAILVVSASDPRFWVMGGLLAASAGFCLRAWRNGTFSRRAVGLLCAQAALFLLAEFLLPWLNERGGLHSWLGEALFPSVARGHGRAFGWLHLPAPVLFFLQYRRSIPPPTA